MHTSVSTRESDEVEGWQKPGDFLPLQTVDESNQGMFLKPVSSFNVIFISGKCCSDWKGHNVCTGHSFRLPLTSSFSRKPSSGVRTPESIQFALTFSRFAESRGTLVTHRGLKHFRPPLRAFQFFHFPLGWSWHSIFRFNHISTS